MSTEESKKKIERPKGETFERYALRLRPDHCGYCGLGPHYDLVQVHREHCKTCGRGIAICELTCSHCEPKTEPKIRAATANKGWGEIDIPGYDPVYGIPSYGLGVKP